MGMKLKSGADLCGFELSRFCVQNDVAIPDAPASGRKYFHTGTGMEGKYSLLGRERIFTGTSWRAAAYVDDLANLDLATNADYLALKEKVDLLSGEVDTDAIINNMKEVTAFLSGFAEDANLMSVLDGKLDKTGGTISKASNEPLLINNTTAGGGCYLDFLVEGTIEAFIGYSSKDMVFMQLAGGSYLAVKKDGAYYGNNTLIHSGNVGDYKAGDSDKLGGKLPKNYGQWLDNGLWGANLNTVRDGFRGGKIYQATNAASDGGYRGFLEYGFEGYVAQFNSDSYNDLYYRWCENNVWKPWRKVAFTDSNVASASALLTDTYKYAFVNGNNVLFGLETAQNSYDTILAGRNISLRYGTTPTTGLILNSSGNVTIGGSDLAGTSATAKLYVDGYVTTKDGVVINAADAYNSYWEKGFLFSSNSALNAGLWGYGYKSLEYLYLGFGNYSAAVGIRINENGNVGIGVASPSAQLHVANDIVANGTIACKGVAAEGSVPVGTVDKWAGSIATGTKSQTYTHGLGTTDITVAIYEKNGNEWVQILTDVDIVNANSIRVTFGANTNVEHRIVVMG